MEGSALNNTTFSSSSPPPSPFASSVAFVLLVVATAVGLPGNLLVVWTVAFCLRRRSVTALFVLQLAAADFLVLLTTPVFLRQLSLGGQWELGECACKLLHYGSAVNMYGSVYLVALMGLDRHLGVVRPFLSQRLSAGSRLRPASAAAWTLALALPSPLLVYRRVRHGVCVLYHPTPSHQVFQYSLETVAAFLLPFGVMAFCYSRIACKLASGRASWRRRSYRKTNRLIGLIVGTFAALWTPYHLFNVLQVAALSSGAAPALLRFCLRSRAAVISLGYLSSAINPLLYAVAGPASARRAPHRGGGLIHLLEATPNNAVPFPAGHRAGAEGIGRGRGSGGGEKPPARQEMTNVPEKREG